MSGHPRNLLEARPLRPSLCAGLVTIVLTAVLVLPLTRPVLAQSRGDRPMLLESDASRARLEGARVLLFQLRLAEADVELYRLARTADGGPAALYHLALGSLIEALLNDTPAAFERFFSRSDSLRELLERAPKGAWRDLLSAEADHQRALAWAKRGQYVRAAMAATAALRGYENALERDPGLSDARKGTGVFEAAVGALPEFFRRFLVVFGFPGDFDRGVAELSRAAHAGGYLADEAAIYLGVLALFELPVPVDGVDVLRGVYERNDRSPIAALPYLEALMRRGQVAAADSVLAEARRRTVPGRSIRVDYFTWFEGESAFRRNRFEEAAERFEAYVRDHRGQALKAMAWLRLGVASDMLGRRVRATEAYRQVVAPREFDSDAAAVRLAARYLERPPDVHERTMQLAANAFDRDDFGEADSLLESLRAEPGASPSIRTETLYRSGRLREQQNRPAEALVYFRQATRRPAHPKDRWIPSSWYRIALIEYAAGRYSEAQEALETLLALPDGYDYHGIIRRQAAILSERVKSARAGPRPP